jgi:K+-sensing histidine kinase KdpD
MEIKNVKRWSKGGAGPYYLGFAGFVLAFCPRYILHPILESHLPILFFAVNCLVVAYYFGFWPSFMMLLISLPAALFFFTTPYNSFNVVEHRDIYISIVNFTLVGLAAYMLELLRREQYKSALLARVSETRYRLLVEADEDRRSAMKKNALP